jgi:hypothetical protein
MELAGPVLTHAQRAEQQNADLGRGQHLMVGQQVQQGPVA